MSGTCTALTVLQWRSALARNMDERVCRKHRELWSSKGELPLPTTPFGIASYAFHCLCENSVQFFHFFESDANQLKIGWKDRLHNRSNWLQQVIVQVADEIKALKRISYSVNTRKLVYTKPWLFYKNPSNSPPTIFCATSIESGSCYPQSPARKKMKQKEPLTSGSSDEMEVETKPYR